MSGLAAYAAAYTATVVIEAAVSALFGFRTARDFGVTVVVNGITHPVLWMVVLGLVAATGPGRAIAAVILLLEVAVVVAEFRLMRWALAPGRQRLFIQALAMNAASLVIGTILWG